MNGPVIWDGIGRILLEIIIALAPLMLLFLVFQFTMLKLPKAYVLNLVKGILLAIAGLALFLQGVHIGFMPAGQEIGAYLGSLSMKWLLIPFGLLAGFLATFGEPAVRILADQVEEASGGSIQKNLVLYTISAGVAIFIAQGMVKIIYGVPLQWIIIPGYLLAMILVWFNDRSLLAVAFDAGGVATGPMAVTFLMAISVGIAASIEGRDPIIDGFGMIALIALAPILTILILGIIIRIKLRRREVKKMPELKLIISIVRKGWGQAALKSSCESGATGGTVINGRGIGVHETQKIFGIAIEPEKEIVLSVIYENKTDTVLNEIVKAAELDKPGNGLAFVVPVEKVAGVVHRALEESESSADPVAEAKSHELPNP